METRTKFEKLIVEKAIKDEAFRSKLIENPNLAIEKEFGVKLPDSTVIRVMVEKTGRYYLVLPQNQTLSPETELTETELQHVAAGSHVWYDEVSDAACI